MRLRAAMLLLALSALTGCGEDRPPVPVLHILIPAAAGVVEINGRSMPYAEAHAEIQRMADANRRPTTHHARLIVRTQIAPGGSAGTEAQVINWCQNAGIQNIHQIR